MSTRQEFRGLLAKIEELEAKFADQTDEYHRFRKGDFDFGREDPAEEYEYDMFVELCEDLKELYLDEFPRRRKVTLNRVKEDLFEEARQLIEEEYQNRFDALPNQIDDLKKQAQKLAQELEPRGSEDEQALIDKSSLSTYRSQGFGQVKYTKQALIPALMKTRNFGIEAEIEDIQDWDDVILGDYGVVAQCSELDAEIIKRRPDPSRKEIVKEMTRQGVNPRVYYRFMDWERIDAIREEMG